MKKFCPWVTDGILVYGEADEDSKEDLLVLDYDRNNEGKFRIFYESIDGFLTQMVENLDFKDAIMLYHIKLEML